MNSVLNIYKRFVEDYEHMSVEQQVEKWLREHPDYVIKDFKVLYIPNSFEEVSYIVFEYNPLFLRVDTNKTKEFKDDYKTHWTYLQSVDSVQTKGEE